ncbi:N-acetylmuramoyl-L-alanine amidase [Luteimonas aquatica]|uniref:N-acetylmuramoyl-L-alanine amidase n=1 Tax=Luteimonas aquatica TaxID=450364 RepID=UPI001F5AA6D4|nr:N-acetylmuramoyl-L-alanine amidase [Luteimonas aquatica]
MSDDRCLSNAFRNAAVLSLACSLGLVFPAGRSMAATPDKEQIPASAKGAPASLQPLLAERAKYRTYFSAAYARYPDLPVGLLEAIAWSETGWTHVRPDPSPQAHRHMPPAYGVMGLYRGEGFANQVREGARLLGVSEAMVMSDPELNILAGAALLDQALRATRERANAAGLSGDDAVLARALAAYAGYGSGGGNIRSYARTSFAYNVLLGAERGITERGVEIPRRKVEWNKAFPGNQLRVLRAPVLNVDVDADRITPESATTAPAAAAPQATASATLAGDFGEAIWNPASSSNYSTASNAASAVILHTTEGSYAGAIAWFQNPSAQVSAHYVIRKSDGQITQMVREYHQAWHAAYHNGYTVGIEHEGYSNDAGTWTDALVNASARLTRSICARRGVNCASAWQGPGYDYWHVVPDSVRVKGHGMLTNNENRYDPGKYFPWGRYYSLINDGAPPSTTPPLYWVDTYANAPGYGSATSTAQTGTLYAGTNYVRCKTWGREIRNGTSFNHWWLKTDLDVGPANQWISAYYLSRWGSDEARDNDGFDIPRCEVLPYGEIAKKYYALGGVRSVLGSPKLAEMAAQQGGRFQQFDKGIILWHTATGAFAVHGKILDQFWATGGETEWGFAKMDEMAAAKSPATGQIGRYQYFQKGLFLWTAATNAHVIHGAILVHFENNGREAKFGYPTSDEQPYNGSGRKQTFERGTFYWTPENGVWVN